jgi:hypothetical protein
MSQSSREFYWSAFLADFRRSGLTRVEFCQLRRIFLYSFRLWLYRLRPGLPPRRSRSPRHATSSTHVPAQAETPPESTDGVRDTWNLYRIVAS